MYTVDKYTVFGFTEKIHCTHKLLICNIHCMLALEWLLAGSVAFTVQIMKKLCFTKCVCVLAFTPRKKCVNESL